MREIFKKYAKDTKNWLILNTGAVPYISSFGMKQWTKGINDRYPENRLVDFCGIRYAKYGSESKYFTNEDSYYHSFEKLIGGDLKSLEEIYADFLEDEKKFKFFISLIVEKGNGYLHDHFDEFIEVYDAEYISGATIDGVLAYSDDFFLDMKQKYPDYEKEINTLISPYGETFLVRYKKQLIETAVKMNGEYGNQEDLLRDIEIKNNIEGIQRSFHWIQNNYKNVDALEIEFFSEQVFELFQKEKNILVSELSRLNESVEKHRKVCEQIKDKRIFSSKDFDRLLWVGKIGWWVDRRKEYNLIANHYIGRHLKFICQKHDMPYDDAVFLLPSEVGLIERGDAVIADFHVSDRKNNSVHTYDIEGNEIIVSGDEASEFWNIVNPEIESYEGSEIKGVTAYGGVIRGVVKVVMDAYNPGKFNEGDVLVTGMTRPDFLSLMKKSSAFITDEGGITCHAAIVARELKKPCIIGTRVATQVLHDGDLVEVDADKGIVKILK